MRKLSDRDLALDRAMIPLGSCTMKLNATAEMIPLTWAEFADLHPFAPLEQAAGYHEMFEELRTAGCATSPATTRSRCSQTPARRANMPASGDPQLSRGTRRRRTATVCLIPSSAHGTNPASAQHGRHGVVVVHCRYARAISTSTI